MTNILRIATSIANSLTTLSKNYDDLVKLQASHATYTDESHLGRPGAWVTFDKPVFHNLICVPLDVAGRIDKEILQVFVETTKADLALNNYVIRAKPPGVIKKTSCKATLL